MVIQLELVGPHTDYIVMNDRQDGFVTPEMLIFNTDARSTCSRNKQPHSEFPEITLLAHQAVYQTGNVFDHPPTQTYVCRRRLAAAKRRRPPSVTPLLFVVVVEFTKSTDTTGDRGSTVVKALCYNSEGRWFDPSWCHWNF